MLGRDGTDDGLGEFRGCFISHPQEFSYIDCCQNKMIKGVSIFRMEKNLVSQEDGMEMISHRNLISYEKLVPHLFHCFISFWSLCFFFLVFSHLVFLFSLSF
jgi:hypothetical protein